MERRTVDKRAIPRVVCALRWSLALLFLALVVKCAWVCDDAYITMRTADNLVLGLGLRWNPDERVQVFTHPLWLFVLCVPYALTLDAYASLLAASLVFTCAFVASFLLLHARGRGTWLALLLLCASKSCVDFSTSGLENPLVHVLLALGYFVAWEGTRSPRALLALALVSGTAAVTRLDALLLFLPPLLLRAAEVFRRSGARQTALAIAAGWVPWIAWEAFSLFYYGELVPNTARAKLDTGLSVADHLRQGGWLLASTLLADPAAILALGLAAWAALRPGGRALRTGLAAIVLWQLYLFRIGGDFMVGRHYTPVLVIAATMLARAELPRRVQHGAAVASVLVLALWPISPLRTGADYGPHETAHVPSFGASGGRGDERAAYFSDTGLFRAERSSFSESPWARLGLELRREAQVRDLKPYLAGPIGMIGFYAGPRVEIIDRLALADPLLARLPMQSGQRWILPGHYERKLPAGYRESRWRSENRIEDPDLAAFYDALHLVIAGDLWSVERMRAIWAIHFGEPRERLERYRERYVRREVALAE